MYLATLKKSSNFRYEIRQSFRCGDNTYGHRLIFDLGEKPNRYFEIYEDYIVLFNPNLLDAVEHALDTAKSSAEKHLEHLLWDFLPPQSKERLKVFQGREEIRVGPLTAVERVQISEQVHIFDRRRLYYLRYGAVDQSRLTRLHEKCCRPLLGQSRDEREFYFIGEEKALEPGMYLQYVYAIFNLQKYFSQSFAPWLPEALAMEEMESHFLKAICRLHNESRFWQGEPESPFLHPHLVRYLIMFFDYRATPRSFFDDFARSFMAGKRAFSWPESKTNTPPDRMGEIFGVDYSELKSMSKNSLNRLYRQKAMELHPDRGGDHEHFVELSEAYNELLRTKNR